MSSDIDFIEYVCDQISLCGEIRYRKMFGDYMIYVNNKPLLLVCDNNVFIRQREEIKEIMSQSGKGYPYDGAKEHYILDVDNNDLVREVISILEPLIPVPKPKRKKPS